MLIVISPQFISSWLSSIESEVAFHGLGSFECIPVLLSRMMHNANLLFYFLVLLRSFLCFFYFSNRFFRIFFPRLFPTRQRPTKVIMESVLGEIDRICGRQTDSSSSSSHNSICGRPVELEVRLADLAAPLTKLVKLTMATQNAGFERPFGDVMFNALALLMDGLEAQR